MQGDNTHSRFQDHLYVISLKRTPQRLEGFFKRNAQTLDEWNVHVIDGVDGAEQKEIFKRSRLISQNILEGWSPGAIGSALSHMLSWRICLQLGKPIVVAEDDAILAKNEEKLEHDSWRGYEPFLLLDGTLTHFCRRKLYCLALLAFCPAYPKEEELKELVNSRAERRICKLKRCFGLPAYRITPETAEYLLRELKPLTSEVITMGRGIPTHFSETLDGILNIHYERIGAKIIFPPLALALNNQNESLTRKHKTLNFQG